MAKIDKNSKAYQQAEHNLFGVINEETRAFSRPVNEFSRPYRIASYYMTASHIDPNFDESAIPGNYASPQPDGPAAEKTENQKSGVDNNAIIQRSVKPSSVFEDTAYLKNNAQSTPLVDATTTGADELKNNFLLDRTTEPIGQNSNVTSLHNTSSPETIFPKTAMLQKNNDSAYSENGSQADQLDKSSIRPFTWKESSSSSFASGPGNDYPVKDIFMTEANKGFSINDLGTLPVSNSMASPASPGQTSSPFVNTLRQVPVESISPAAHADSFTDTTIMRKEKDNIGLPDPFGLYGSKNKHEDGNAFFSVPERTGRSLGMSLDGYRQSGGPVNADGNYLVGENGPEILSMGNKGGTIVPNGVGGGNNKSFNVTIQNVNIATTKERTKEDLVQDVKSALEELAKSEFRAQTGILKG